jgi:hypothetical protein
MSVVRIIAPILLIVLAIFIIAMVAVFTIPEKQPENCVEIAKYNNVRERVVVCSDGAVLRWKK